jgi:hypothetical protein
MYAHVYSSYSSHDMVIPCVWYGMVPLVYVRVPWHQCVRTMTVCQVLVPWYPAVGCLVSAAIVSGWAANFWKTAATVSFLRDALLVQLPSSELADDEG